MDWTLLIIPLIALGIWILQYLFRSAAENKPEERSRSSNRSDRSRRNDSELERYVNDARREREQATRKSRIPVPPRPQPGKPVVASRPLAVLELAPEHLRGSLEQRLEAREASGPRSVETPKAAPLPSPTVILSPPPAAPAPLVTARRPAKVLPYVPQGSTLLELDRLLRSPVSIRAAIVLNEVLGAPVSRRKGPPHEWPL